MSQAMPWTELPIEAFDLGEGPTWNARDQLLSVVDINAGALHELNPATGARRVAHVGQPLGAAVERETGGYVLAMRDGVAVIGADALAAVPLGGPVAEHRTEVEWIAPDMVPASHRLNDAACDPRGRLWAGSIALEFASAPGSLYRIEPDGTWAEMLDGLALSNGMGWTADGRTYFLIDSLMHVMWAYDFDERTGELSGRRRHIEFDPERGTPDGMAVDIDGHVWVALYGGQAVERYRPDGSLERRVPIAALNPTCPGLGGPQLRDLYVTSASQFMDAPTGGDGRTFVASVQVAGVPAHRFAG